MNFSQLDFWATLVVCTCVVLGARPLFQRIGVGSSFDRVALLAMSLTLFLRAAQLGALVLIGEVAFNYAMVRWMMVSQARRARILAILTICFDLLLLVYFKYTHFVLNDIIGLVAPAFAEKFAAIIPANENIPPGLSFHSFQMVAYVLDVSRSGLRSPTLVNFANFTTFFPQTVAGPIERHSRLPEFEHFRFRWPTRDAVDKAMSYIAVGLCMKVVLSDGLSPYVGAENVANAMAVWWSSFLFGLRIYFDFAGYSLIALGLAGLFGIDLTLNFKAPYVATNIQDFWRRWHVSLSSWFRDYVYIPLGGSRHRRVRNTVLVFGLSGLWHGAGWNYVGWGLYHGVLLAIYYSVKRYLKVPRAVAWLATMVAVVFGWLLFMENNAARLLTKIRLILTPSAYSPRDISTVLPGPPILRADLLVLLTLSIVLIIFEHTRKRVDPDVYNAPMNPWLTRAALMLAILGAAKSSPQFIYFSF